MRKLIFVLLLLLGIVFIIVRSAEVQSVVETLQKGDIRFILLAIGVECAWILNSSATYQVIFRTMGVEEKLSRLIFLFTAANFANIVAPSGGMSGLAIFISNSHQSGHSSGRVTAASVLFLLYDYVSFLFILTLGFIVLIRRNNLTVPDIIAAIILIAIASALATLLYLGTRSAQKLGNALAWSAKLINKLLMPFIHRSYLQESRAYQFAAEAADGLSEIRNDPKHLFTPLLLAVISKTLLLGTLFLVFVAFEVPVSIGTIIASYSIGYLFAIVSPTPAGIGIVEGILTLTLSSFYITLGTSAVIALAFRGITFWLPLIFGFVAFRFVESKENSSTTTDHIK